MNQHADTNEPQPPATLSAWLVDSERAPLAQCRKTLDTWADVVYFEQLPAVDEWLTPPDVVFFSAEIAGGSGGEAFGEMLARAETVPLIAVARLRSLAQAVGYFRAGAADYLSLPLDEDDARERAEAAIERAAGMAMPGFMVELEPVDSDPGEISLSVTSAVPAEEKEEDILAKLPPPPDSVFSVSDGSSVEKDVPGATRKPESADSADTDEAENEEDEPVAVDGLPIPLLWDELPCGLLVFDSEANLAFANQPGLELFGYETLLELEEALENNRASFNALTAQQKPLSDNQWPHLLAAKTRTARSSLISIEKPDKRRVWLRIDCRPHIHDGSISRLLLTAVNLTGELPPVSSDPAPSTQKPSQPSRLKGKSRKKSKHRK